MQADQARGQGLQTAISVGATILGALLGRKAFSAGTIGKATTAARGAGRIIKETSDVGRAKETVAAVQQQLDDLEAQAAQDTGGLGSPADALSEPLDTVRLLPKRGSVTVKLLTLLWMPE